MRNLNELNEFRNTTFELGAIGALGGERAGYFELPYSAPSQDPPTFKRVLVVPKTTSVLRVLASAGMGWDHLSVSLPDRTPTWEEMEHVRQLFAKPAEVWYQFGVPAKQHVNFHPYCLHWWRHQHREVRLPPSIMVGPQTPAVAPLRSDR